MKINLAEVLQLEMEVIGFKSQNGYLPGILSKDIPFPLKFKIETKLIPLIQPAVKLINIKKGELALSNGAAESGGSYQFLVDKEGVLVDKPAFDKFNYELNEFLLNQENDISIDFSVKLSLLEKITGGEHFPIFCKFVEDDM